MDASKLFRDATQHAEALGPDRTWLRNFARITSETLWQTIVSTLITDAYCMSGPTKSVSRLCPK